MRLPLVKGVRGIFHIYTEMLNPKESALCAEAYGIDTFITPGANRGCGDNEWYGKSAAVDATNTIILYRLPNQSIKYQKWLS